MMGCLLRDPETRELVQLQLGEDEVDDTQVIIWVKGKEQIIVRDSDEEMEEAGGGGASGEAANA